MSKIVFSDIKVWKTESLPQRITSLEDGKQFPSNEISECQTVYGHFFSVIYILTVMQKIAAFAYVWYQKYISSTINYRLSPFYRSLNPSMSYTHPVAGEILCWWSDLQLLNFLNDSIPETLKDWVRKAWKLYIFIFFKKLEILESANSCSMWKEENFLKGNFRELMIFENLK